jgi:hypothetical protein
MVFLPILAFFAFWFFSGNTRREPNWRAAFIQAMIMWWSYMVIMTEILGVFKGITRLGLSITWLLVIVAFILWFVVLFKRGFIFRLPLIYHPTSKAVLAWDIVLTIIVLIPLIIGFISPPNSQEAMGFGMTRVAHWAQNQSLAHFATQNEGLNSAPPGIGIGLLNMYVLSGSDRWCNVITWFAYLGCIQAVIAITRMFGAWAEGTRHAAVFGATLPIGLALASGCLDDLPATLWVVSYVMMVFFFREDNNYKFNVILAAFAAGLAFLTKPATVLLLLPFGIYLYALQIGKIRFTKIFKRLMLTAVIILGLVSGFVIRNFATYGSAIQVSAYFNTLNDEYSWRVTVSNLLRNLALQADLPFPRADNWLQGQILSFHSRIGMDVNDPKITFGGFFAIPKMNTSEMTSGNPLHTIVIAGVTIAAIITLIKRKDKSSRSVIIFTSLLIASYLLFNIFLKWQPTGTRLQLPYYFLFAPIIGYNFDFLDQRKLPVGSIICSLLVLAAIPWLFSVKERPVIPIAEFTQTRSILQSTRPQMYFNTQPEDYDLYITAGNYILGQPMNQRVGLDVEGPFLEYPLWAVMKTIEKHNSIAYLNAAGESSRYLLRSFEPSAIFSTHCDENSEGNAFLLLKKSDTGACFFIKK